MLFVALLLSPTQAMSSPLQSPTMQEASLTLVSAGNGGSEASGSSGSPAMSTEGSRIAFASLSSNLVAVDANQVTDIFVYNTTSGKLELVSVSAQDVQGNGPSYQPSISADGRWIAFTSLADNLAPGDTNGSPDIFLRDLETGQIERVSVSSSQAQANERSDSPVLSMDGRWIVFASMGTDLVEADTNGMPDVFIHDRLSGQTRRVSVTSEGEQADGWSSFPSISADGRFIAFLSAAQNLDPGSGQGEAYPAIFLHDNLTGSTRRISDRPVGLTRPVLSMDGRRIAYLAREGEFFSIRVYDRTLGSASSIPGSFAKNALSLAYSLALDGGTLAFTNSEEPQGPVHLYNLNQPDAAPEPGLNLPSGYTPSRLTLSGTGQALAFVAAQPADPEGQLPRQDIYLDGLPGRQKTLASVSGWVSDGFGHPMAGISLSDQFGHSATTTADGSFAMDDLFPGGYILTPARTGYRFVPDHLKLITAPGSPSSAGLEFTATPAEAVLEARKDLGMPYAMNRGCASPFQGCDGPFHGFFSGMCTDLVLDAYLYGLDWNIQVALLMDVRSHPDHYYDLYDARNAGDLWRYFAYRRLVLSHAEPYLPGDIAFFDWEKDGILDHVALVSEVDGQNRPQKMLDATGITADNPGGLATTTTWKDLHENSVIGHARWLGPSLSQPEALDDRPYLLAGLDAAGGEMRITDEAGRQASSASVDLPEATYREMGISRVISIPNPQAGSRQYTLELTSPTALPYQLGIQTTRAGMLNSRLSYSGTLAAGQTLTLQLRLSETDGNLILSAP